MVEVKMKIVKDYLIIVGLLWLAVLLSDCGETGGFGSSGGGGPGGGEPVIDTLFTDGFEGDKAKSGPQKGQRVVNGWKNSNLSWSYKLKPSKLYQEM